MPNPSDSSSEYSSDSEEVLSDNIDIESNDSNHGNEDNDSVVAGLSSSAFGVVDDMVSRPPWG